VRILAVLYIDLAAVTAPIDLIFAALPDAAIYRSMPGIGPRLGGRLAAIFGQPRQALPQ
jgi:hypothetical protein